MNSVVAQPARTHDHRAGTVPLRTQFQTRRSRSPRSSLHHSTYTAPLFYAGPHTPLPPPAVVSQHAQRLFPIQGPHPFLGRPFFLPTCSALRRAPRPLARTNARSRTHGRPTNERRDVRSAGVADWITARGGGTERTLTAAAGPSPRDPYRHALTMRPPRKVRPFSFLNYYS